MFRQLLSAKFLRFALVGGLTAVLYAGGISLFLGILGLDYRLGISLAYVVAVSFHFLCNRRFTFNAAKGGMPAQVAKYCCLLAVNYLIVLAVAVLCVDHLGISAYVASGLSLFGTTILAYLALNRWIFTSSAAREQA